MRRSTADLSRYFDTIPQDDLLKSVARVADGAVLRLIKLWLKAPIEERGGDGKWWIVGGKGNRRGTPQGGIASPLLTSWNVHSTTASATALS